MVRRNTPTGRPGRPDRCRCPEREARGVQVLAAEALPRTDRWCTATRGAGQRKVETAANRWKRRGLRRVSAAAADETPIRHYAQAGDVALATTDRSWKVQPDHRRP